MTPLPPMLVNPVTLAGHSVIKVLFDLTIYLKGPSLAELDFLIDLYRATCPARLQVKYKIAEVSFWPQLAKPPLTASGRAAARRNVKDAFLEPVRQRIRAGRAFELQFWDGRSIDDPRGAWSFNCQRIHKRKTGLHAFVRFLLPLDEDPNVLIDLADSVAGNVEFWSGHGGLAFAYDPWHMSAAFDAIYARAKRFWCLDIEYLNATLPLMNDHIKGVGWLTLLGADLVSSDPLRASLSGLASEPDVASSDRQYGKVIKIGASPVVGDVHRPGANNLAPYFVVAKALAPLFITSIRSFPGAAFVNRGDTVGWFRRYIDLNAW